MHEQDDELNDQLMEHLIETLGARRYLQLRQRLIESGLDDPLILNTMMTEMCFFYSLNAPCTLIVHDMASKTHAEVHEGALVTHLQKHDTL